MSQSHSPDPSDWSDEQIDALLERLEEHVDTELGQAVKSRRRDVLKAIGAIGAGGVAGAAGMEAATGGARAGSNQVGTIGTSSDRVDIFSEDIDSKSVQTDNFNDIHHVDSLAEAQTVINNTTAPSNISTQGGTLIILPEADLTPADSDLPVTLKPGVAIVGRSARATRIDMGSSSKDLFKLDRSGGTTGHYIRLADFMVSGGSGARAVNINNVNNVKLWNLYIRNGPAGVKFTEVIDGSLINVHVSNNQNGIGLEVVSNSNNLQVSHSEFAGGANEGAVVTGTAGAFFSQCRFEGNDLWGLRAEDGTKLMISDSYLEDNGADQDRDNDSTLEPASIGLHPDPAVAGKITRPVIRDNYFNFRSDGVGETGVVCGDAEAPRIEGNSFPTAGRAAVEMHPETLRLEFHNDVGGETIVQNLSGEAYDNQEINGGQFHVRDFGDDPGEALQVMRNGNGAAELQLLPETVNTALTLDVAGMTLRGAGRESVIDGGTTGTAITVSASDVTVADLAVQTTAGSGNSYHGIDITASDATIRGVTVIDSDATGIQSSAKRTTVTESTVESTDLEGINMSNGAEQSLVTDCRLQTNVGAEAIQVADSRVRVADNNIFDPGDDGIFLAADDCIAVNNMILFAGANGIIANGTDDIIGGNRIKGSTSSAIDTSSATTPTEYGNNTGA